MTRKRYILEKCAAIPVVIPAVTNAVRYGGPSAMRFLNLAFNRFSRGAGKMLSAGKDVGKAITAPPSGFVQPQNIKSRLTSGASDFGQGFKHVGKSVMTTIPILQKNPTIRPLTVQQWTQKKEEQQPSINTGLK